MDVETIREKYGGKRNEIWEKDVIFNCLEDLVELNAITEKFGVRISKTKEYKYILKYLFDKAEEYKKYELEPPTILINKGII